MQAPRILIVDDEATLRTALFRTLEKKGYQVITASQAGEAISYASAGVDIDLALIDLRLPDSDGIELMNQLRARRQSTQFIILTGHGSIESAVLATQKGAYHFMTKPFNLDELLSIVDRALQHRKLQQENSLLKNELKKKYEFHNIVGTSPEIRAVLDLVERVSDCDSTVLITGESGTGKELIAKAIHYNSLRREAAFVPVNCGAIPSELLESELFGHVKGAFTGAVQNRPGRFEVAENGSLFLDEIGDLSLSLQVKLLRVIQDRRFEPVGSTRTHEVNVRIIAATHVNLERAIEMGKFREDLFYRLNVIPIHIPALRERRSDIPLLIHHFVEHYNKTKARKIEGFTSEALDYLFHYTWPGNIRELENLIERMAIIKGSGLIQVGDLPPKYLKRSADIRGPERVDIPETGMDFNSAVDAYENALIVKALEKTGWNRNQAAALLKLNRTTLVEKIKKKGLRPPSLDL